MTKSPHPSSVDKGEILPVTVEARKAACEYLSDIAALRGKEAVTDIHDDHPTLIAFARFERDIRANQARSLPGDALREAFLKGWDACWTRKAGAPFERDGGRQTAWEKHRAALTPSALSGDAGEVEKLRTQLQAVGGTLALLEQAATEVHRKGAVGGAQWPKLAGALVRARAWTDTHRAALPSQQGTKP